MITATACCIIGLPTVEQHAGGRRAYAVSHRLPYVYAAAGQHNCGADITFRDVGSSAAVLR